MEMEVINLKGGRRQQESSMEKWHLNQEALKIPTDEGPAGAEAGGGAAKTEGQSGRAAWAGDAVPVCRASGGKGKWKGLGLQDLWEPRTATATLYPQCLRSDTPPPTAKQTM